MKIKTIVLTLATLLAVGCQWGQKLHFPTSDADLLAYTERQGFDLVLAASTGDTLLAVMARSGEEHGMMTRFRQLSNGYESSSTGWDYRRDTNCLAPVDGSTARLQLSASGNELLLKGISLSDDTLRFDLVVADTLTASCRLLAAGKATLGANPLVDWQVQAMVAAAVEAMTSSSTLFYDSDNDLDVPEAPEAPEVDDAAMALTHSVAGDGERTALDELGDYAFSLGFNYVGIEYTDSTDLHGTMRASGAIGGIDNCYLRMERMAQRANELGLVPWSVKHSGAHTSCTFTASI